MPANKQYRVKLRDYEAFSEVLEKMPKRDTIAYAVRRFLADVRELGLEAFIAQILEFHEDRGWREKGQLVDATTSPAEDELLEKMAEMIELHRDAEPGRRGKVTNPVRASTIVGYAMIRYVEKVRRREARQAETPEIQGGELEWVGWIALSQGRTMEIRVDGATIPLTGWSDLKVFQDAIRLQSVAPWISWGDGGRVLQCALCHEMWSDKMMPKDSPAPLADGFRAGWVNRHIQCREMAMEKAGKK